MIVKEETFVIKVSNHLCCYYVDLKTIKKAVYMKLRIECFREDSNVSFDLDIFCSLAHVVSTWLNSNQRNEQRAVSSLFFLKDKDTEKAEEITVIKVVSSATKETPNAELRFAVNEIDKSHGRPKKYSRKVKKEVGNHPLTFGASPATKQFSVKYPVGRPNLLDDTLIKKVKDIVIGTRHADGVINRRHVNIAKGVVRANTPDILKAFGGTVELTNRWARSVLSDLNWLK